MLGDLYVIGRNFSLNSNFRYATPLLLINKYVLNVWTYEELNIENPPASQRKGQPRKLRKTNHFYLLCCTCFILPLWK